MSNKLFQIFILAAVCLAAVPASGQGYVIYKSDGTIERLHHTAVDSITTYTDTTEYIDMGRGVKWATCNLGATNQWDAGYYLAWGETSPKADYSATTYADPTYAEIPDTIAGTTCDAARMLLGDEWRMPTLTELNDLCDTLYTRWQLDTIAGTPGYTITSRINGATLFIPATGYYSGTKLTSPGSAASYWGEAKRPDKAEQAYCMIVIVRGTTVLRSTSSTSRRYYGRNLRPVRR